MTWAPVWMIFQVCEADLNQIKNNLVTELNQILYYFEGNISHKTHEGMNNTFLTSMSSICMMNSTCMSS